MRIAYIIGCFPSLSETFVLDQITGLIDRGHEVDIYAQITGDVCESHEQVEKYNLLAKTRYVESVPRKWLSRFAGAMQVVATRIWTRPRCVLRCLNCFRFGRRALSMRMLYMAMPYLGAKPYDIIHCHFGPNGEYAQKLRKLGAIKGKIITTFHAYDIYKYPHQSGNGVYKQLFAEGDLFAAICQAGKTELEQLGCPKDRLTIHHMGVDTNELVFENHQLRQQSISLLTVGRLVEKKGIEYGIRAAAILKRNYANIRYTIVGDGPLRRELEQLIDELDLGDEVKLVGAKKRDEVTQLRDQADVLLAPSVTTYDGNREGIPVTIMEAMATGLCVVSTRHSGIGELIEDGVSGLLLDEREIEGLAQAVDKIISDEQFRLNMSIAARKRVEDQFDLNKLNDQLVEMFENLLVRNK